MDTRGKRPRGYGRDAILVAVVDALRAAGPRGCTKKELAEQIGRTSAPSLQRALTDLRDLHDAPVEYVRATRRWVLENRQFSLPLHAPEGQDLVAMLVAEAIIAPVVDSELRQRIRRVAEELDQRLRATGQPARVPAAAAMSATLTLGTPVEPEILRRLLLACRRERCRIHYRSPWHVEEQTERSYEIEPWAVRVHDGAAYLRAWCIDAAQPRTFRVAQIHRIEAWSSPATRACPGPERVWDDGDPMFGIDQDRPGRAVLRLRGAVARWVAAIVWHPEQRDQWLVPDQLLERSLPYRSCRELARRICGVIDGVEGIDPPELDSEVRHMFEAYLTRARLPGGFGRVRARPDSPQAKRRAG